jgi:hypothetical protein
MPVEKHGSSGGRGPTTLTRGPESGQAGQGKRQSRPSRRRRGRGVRKESLPRPGRIDDRQRQR